MCAEDDGQNVFTGRGGQGHGHGVGFGFGGVYGAFRFGKGLGLVQGSRLSLVLSLVCSWILSRGR